jgi:hypothetical protein
VRPHSHAQGGGTWARTLTTGNALRRAVDHGEGAVTRGAATTDRSTLRTVVVARGCGADEHHAIGEEDCGRRTAGGQ